mgnify:CR=1 FL=1
MFSLKGKTALITGSGRGIGLAIAEAMAHQGADIFLSDINGSVVERAAGELAGKYPNVAVRGLTFDVTDKAQIESAMQTIRDAGNGLQILVNNAGINLREPVADMDDALWQKMLDTNLTSVFRVSRAAFPMLREKGGKVINLCSLMSEIARPTVSPYASTKGAVRQFTRALATEWAEHNIQVNGIAPGFIATDMNIPLMEDKELNNYIMRHTPAKAVRSGFGGGLPRLARSGFRERAGDLHRRRVHHFFVTGGVPAARTFAKKILAAPGWKCGGSLCMEGMPNSVRRFHADQRHRLERAGHCGAH